MFRFKILIFRRVQMIYIHCICLHRYIRYNRVLGDP